MEAAHSFLDAQVLRLIYIDNFAALGLTKEVVQPDFSTRYFERAWALLPDWTGLGTLLFMLATRPRLVFDWCNAFYPRGGVEPLVVFQNVVAT